MFTPTPPTDLAPQGHGVGLSPGDSGRGRGHPEDKPQTQEKHKTEKGRWGCPLPTRLSAGGADHEAGRMGPLMGKWGLPDFSSSLFFSPSFIHRNLFFRPLFSFLPPLSLSYTHIQLFCFSEPHLPRPTFPFSPPHLYALESVETPALPNQRCQKWGHDWTEDMGHAPRASPPCPSRRLYYLIRSSS